MSYPQIFTIVILILLFLRDWIRGLQCAIQAKIDERNKLLPELRKKDDSVSAVVLLFITTFINTSLIIGCLVWFLILEGFWKAHA